MKRTDWEITPVEVERAKFLLDARASMLKELEPGHGHDDDKCLLRKFDGDRRWKMYYEGNDLHEIGEIDTALAIVACRAMLAAIDKELKDLGVEIE